MKTFIWVSEYEVFVINDEDVDSARERLKTKLEAYELKLVKEEEDKRYGYRYDEVSYRPSYTLSEGEDISFDHTNE